MRSMQVHQSLSHHKARVEGDRLFLRTLLPEDVSESYAAWLNDPVVNAYLETRSVTDSELREYVQKKNESDSAMLFGIFWKGSWEHIGNVKLEPVDFEKGTAIMGILIGNKRYWGKGIGTEVTNLITNFTFDHLGVHEVHLGVIAEHASAIRVYEKCGYTINSIEKDSINHDGVLYDKICMVKRSTLVL